MEASKWPCGWACPGYTIFLCLGITHQKKNIYQISVPTKQVYPPDLISGLSDKADKDLSKTLKRHCLHNPNLCWISKLSKYWDCCSATVGMGGASPSLM